MSRALAVFLLVALTILAGCGGDDDSSESGGKVNLTMWYWGLPEEKGMRKVVDQYNADHPNVKVKLVTQPFDSYFTLLRSAVAARKGPDVFATYATPILFDYYKGLTALDEYVTDEQREDLVGWDQVSALDGTPYAVPWTGNGIQMYYNKALFKKAGLDPEAPPTTWSEMLDACDALKDAGIVPIVAGFKDGYYGEWWGDLFATQYLPEDEIPEFAKNPDWSDPRIVKGVQLMVDMVERGCTTPDSVGQPLFPDTVDAFGAGKGAIFIGLTGQTADWFTYSESLGKDLGAMLPPLVDGSTFSEQRPNFAAGTGLAIAKWTDHPDEAYDFISYLTSADVQSQLAETANIIPNNKKSEFTTDDPVGQQVLEWSRGADAPVFVGPFTEIRLNPQAVYDKVVPQMVSGELSVADAMEQVQAEQEKLTPVPNE